VYNQSERVRFVARGTGRPATIRDVAARAGVSFKSVSNVVNDRPYVSDELRVKVQQAIDELGYRPHSIARSLASSRSNILGVVLRATLVDARADPFFSQFLLGVCATAGAQGFGVLVQILASDEPIMHYADLFDHRQVDGLIMHSPRVDDDPGGSDGKDDLPAVRVGRAPPHTDALAVDGDDEQGAFLAVQHLIRLGHQRIGMIANASPAFTVSITRTLGYRRALAAHGLEFDSNLLISGHFTMQSGRDGMAALLDLPQPPTACFVSSDRMALGAMQECKSRGLAIPADMAIVGYDDLFVAGHTSPRLTSVRAPIDAISTQATQMLIDSIRGLTVEPRQVILPTELVVRDSCGGTRDDGAQPAQATHARLG
jgi:DNA-binding LacI/PurR family transcriptional regulator